MNVEKQKKFLIHAAFFGVIIAGGYLCLSYLLPPLTPFLIGFLIAWLLHKPAKAIADKLRISVRFPALALTCVFYVAVVLAISMAGIQLISALQDFLSRLPALVTEVLLPLVNQSLDKVEAWLQQYDPSIALRLDTIASEVFTSIEKTITNLSALALKAISASITAIPSFILKVILTVVTTFFCSLDFEQMTGFFKRKLPEATRTALTQTIQTSVTSIWRIILSYLLIMGMTFIELSIGLTLMNIPYAVGIALLIAIFDIMPILGAGGILIPWAIVAFVMKNISQGIGILLIYIFILIVRNIVEPKLVGKQIGLHPLVTLMSLIVGLHFYGVIGMFACPIALSILLRLYKSGKFSAFVKRQSGTAA